MKQVVQNARTGKLELLEVPVPSPSPGQVLVRNHFSVVSTGTEKDALSFARMSLLAKARTRPDLVAQVRRKLREEGPVPTYRSVMTRLDAAQPLGYSSAGVVESIGDGVTRFAPGDRVACAGAGYANHAEFIVVPENLIAQVPEAVDLELASFATVGAIALQGIRVSEPRLGEIGAVIGLGLIGQLTVQLLRANGCRVIGSDLDPNRVKSAREQGAECTFQPDAVPEATLRDITEGYGVDLAVVTASSERSDPLTLAADLCRHKGRVTLVGNMPMELDRRTFYEKELELRMSTSYGPGRYDRSYEEAGFDYPLPYVRWTENRNLQAFLRLVANGSVHPEWLDPQLVPFEQALELYEGLARQTPATLAQVFQYRSDAPLGRAIPLEDTKQDESREAIGVAFIGAGNYAKSTLLPALGSVEGVKRISLVAATGTSARHSAEHFGFASCGTDPQTSFDDPEVGLVFVATRHDSHAALAVAALRSGKSVWVEKPIGLSLEEVARVEQAVCETGGFLTVGYNRRFSPHARAVRAAFDNRRAPMVIRYTVAAGAPPRGTWVTDPREGGGRIIGEVCHFVDLCSYFVGSPPRSVYAHALGRDPESDDSLVALLGFPDGSAATIEYLARTSPELPKERFEVSADERTASCDNFRLTRVDGQKDIRTFNQDKGQATAVSEVISALRHGRSSPFTIFEITAVARATFAISESIGTGREIQLGP